MEADGAVRGQGTLSSGLSGPLLPKIQLGLVPLSSLEPDPSKHLLGKEIVPRETDPMGLKRPSSPVAMVTRISPPPPFLAALWLRRQAPPPPQRLGSGA